jgi:hypothetical protein
MCRGEQYIILILLQNGGGAQQDAKPTFSPHSPPGKAAEIEFGSPNLDGFCQGLSWLGIPF